MLHRKRYLNVFLSPILVDFLMDRNMKTCLSWFTVTVTIMIFIVDLHVVYNNSQADILEGPVELEKIN